MSGFSKVNKSIIEGNGSLTINPFGSLETAELTPLGQGAFIYGINPLQWLTTSFGTGGGVSAVNGILTCSSGTSTSGVSSIQLLRSFKYRPGQGGICRLTALFGESQMNAFQLAGFANADSGYYFGRQNHDFGIFHFSSASREIRKLTISTAAGTENITITLNDISTTFSITGGSNLYQTAHQLSLQNYFFTTQGWLTDVIGNSIYFSSVRPAPFAGSYSLTTSGVASGSFTRIQPGVFSAREFISQSQWNIDKMDGTGPSKMLLNPSKGNVYEIGCQYLGFGNAIFSIEDSQKGNITPCHMIQNANSRTTPVLKNPYLTTAWVAANAGTTSSVTIHGVSTGVFHEGKINKALGPSFAIDTLKLGIDTTNTHIITLRSNRIFNNASCYGEIEPFNISIGNDSGSNTATRLLQVFIYKNLTLTGPTNYQYIDMNKSIVTYNTSSTGFSFNENSALVKSFVVAANGATTLSLINENFFITNGETLSVTAKSLSGGGDSDVSVAISWFEDQ